MPGGERGVVWNDAELLLPGERFFAQLVPAAVELAFVFVRPFLRDMMGRVGRARREIHHERLVGHQHLLLAHPGDGAVREVFRQRIALLGRLGRLHGRCALIEPGKVLVRLAADEAVEMLEARTGRPLVERPHGRDFPIGHFVALAELRRRIAVELQDLGQRRFFLGPDAVVARRRRRHLGDRAHADGVMVSTGEKRLARRRAQSGRVEPIVLQPIGRKAFGGGRVARAAKGARGAEADIVEENDQDVRRAFRRAQRHDRGIFRVGILGVVSRQTDMLRVRNWQNVAGKFLVRIGHGVCSPWQARGLLRCPPNVETVVTRERARLSSTHEQSFQAGMTGRAGRDSI